MTKNASTSSGVSGIVLLPGNATGQMKMETVSSSGVSKRNYIVKGTPKDWVASADAPLPQFEETEEFDGLTLWQWSGGDATTTAAVVAEINLSRAPSLAGVAVYAALQFEAVSTNTSVSALINDGAAEITAAPQVGVMTVVSVPVTTASEGGTLRVSIRVERAGGNAVIQIAKVVVAPVGAPWDSVGAWRLKADDDV